MSGEVLAGFIFTMSTQKEPAWQKGKRPTEDSPLPPLRLGCRSAGRGR